MATDEPFKVEEWDRDGNRIERVIARADNLIVGRRAYEAARRQYPKARLTLRQGIRVIEETETQNFRPSNVANGARRLRVWAPDGSKYRTNKYEAVVVHRPALVDA
jgi:hypothetical protein